MKNSITVRKLKRYTHSDSQATSTSSGNPPDHTHARPKPIIKFVISPEDGKLGKTSFSYYALAIMLALIATCDATVAATAVGSPVASTSD